MRRLGALAAALTMSATVSALAQSHSQEDEAACTPDVMKLCQQFVPKRDDIISCLNEKKRELSPECFKVFTRPPGQQAAEEERRRRRKPTAHAPN
jgi:hypothetical protein